MPDGAVSSGSGCSASRMKNSGIAPANSTPAPRINGSQPSIPIKLINSGPAPKLADRMLE